jgi:hypothetical protein
VYLAIFFLAIAKRFFVKLAFGRKARAMIKKLQLLRNIGQFDSVSSGGNVPLSRLSLVSAENGRGKTTLAAILRSLATGGRPGVRLLSLNNLDGLLSRLLLPVR